MTRERRFAPIELHDGRFVLRGPIAADEVVVLDVDMATGALREAWIQPAPLVLAAATRDTFRVE